MEGSFLRLGFPTQWINVVASLYREAFSSFLVAEGQTRKFSISRFVRQGCPLAPFLFLLVMETFSMYLNSSQVSLKGLPLPATQQQMLVAEFANDTAIYVQDNDENLSKLQEVVEEFCLASRAKINWHKKSIAYLDALARIQMGS